MSPVPHPCVSSCGECMTVLTIVVVRFQHKYYVPIALFSGLVLPYLIGKYGWDDGLGGLVWGGAVARLLIWLASSRFTSA